MKLTNKQLSRVAKSIRLAKSTRQGQTEDIEDFAKASLYNVDTAQDLINQIEKQVVDVSDLLLEMEKLLEGVLGKDGHPQRPLDVEMLTDLQYEANQSISSIQENAEDALDETMKVSLDYYENL